LLPADKRRCEEVEPTATFGEDPVRVALRRRLEGFRTSAGIDESRLLTLPPGLAASSSAAVEGFPLLTFMLERALRRALWITFSRMHETISA
jgi:hypothetical protein